MSASKASRISKKKDVLDKQLKEACLNPIPLAQNSHDKTNIENQNATLNEASASGKNKKKKKKKKKSQSASSDSVTEVDNDKMPDGDMFSDVEQKLSKLSELDVIVLPQAPIIEEKIENQTPPPNLTNNCGVESGTAKKKKKKKKQKNPGTNAEPSQNSDPAGIPKPPVEPSFLKMTQFKDSPVLLVSTLEKLRKNDSSNQKLLEQNAVAIADASQQATVQLVNQPKQPVKQNAEFNLNKIASMQPFAGMMMQSNSVTLTPINNVSNNHNNPQVQQQLPPSSDSCNSEAPMEKTEANAAPQKTKAQVKAERRAIQEAQRAAKEANKKASSQVDGDISTSKSAAQSKSVTAMQSKSVTAPQSKSATAVAAKTSSKASKEVQKTGFSHLLQFKSSVLLEKHLASDDFIHPAVIFVGHEYARENILESNDCCIKILEALKQVVKDYETPPNKEMSRDLGAKIEMSITFLSKCRPLSVGTLNALKSLKLQICNISIKQSDDEAKEKICTQIDKYVGDSIVLAATAISNFVSREIKNSEVILTYGYSSVVINALRKAYGKGKRFKVVIVDSRPTMEGKEMLRCLLKSGIPCSYALISALTYAMNKVTKVIVGAYAVRASGYIMSRIGSSQIALLASSRNIPFLVCCETYKFCERALIDSFVDNELGDPENFVKTGNSYTAILQNWKNMPHLDLLNLLYDTTPPHIVSKLITENTEKSTSL